MSPTLIKVSVQFSVHHALCVLSLFGEPTGDEIFSLRFQYKGKQIQIAKMGRAVLCQYYCPLLNATHAKCYRFYSLGCKGSVRTVHNRFCVRI